MGSPSPALQGPASPGIHRQIAPSQVLSRGRHLDSGGCTPAQRIYQGLWSPRCCRGFEGAGAQCCSAQSVLHARRATLALDFCCWVCSPLRSWHSFSPEKLLDGWYLLVLHECQVPLSKAQGDPGTGEEGGLEGAKADSEKSTTVKNQELQKELAPCPTPPQHIGIQAEICGMKVKLGGQLQSFLICSSWLLSPLSILHTSSGLAADFNSKTSSASSSPLRQHPCISL